MKIKYNTPEIMVEELAKADVLCESSAQLPESPDNDAVTTTQWTRLSKFL